MNYLVNPSNCQIEGSGIHLEPRLQEYVTKKETYRKYNINPVVPLEVEYGITQEDKKKIKMMKKTGGQLFEDACNPIYHENISNASLDSANMLDNQFSNKGFLSDNIKDEKFDKMLKKHEKIRQKDEMRRERILENQEKNVHQLSGWLGNNNNDIIDSRYFSNDSNKSRYNDNQFNNISQYDNEITNYNSENTYKPSKPTINKPAITKERTFTKAKDDFYNPYLVNHHNDKNYAPQIAYKQRLHQDDTVIDNQVNDNDIDNIIGNYDSYRKQVQPKFQMTADFDLEHKRNIPFVSSNGKKDINTSSYKTMPFMGYDTDAKNVNDETELRCGMPLRTHKSYGYSNPFENQFQYISNDIQNPEHTVLPFPRGGYGTRQYNRESYKDNQYKREIYK